MAVINKTVRENIRKLRLAKSLTQEKLAYSAKLHRAYIGQIERGEKKIGLTNLQKIANALKTDLKKFLD